MLCCYLEKCPINTERGGGQLEQIGRLAILTNMVSLIDQYSLLPLLLIVNLVPDEHHDERCNKLDAVWLIEGKSVPAVRRTARSTWDLLLDQFV